MLELFKYLGKMTHLKLQREYICAACTQEVVNPIFDDHATPQRIDKYGRQRAKQQFSMESIAGELRDAYESATSKTKQRSVLAEYKT